MVDRVKRRHFGANKKIHCNTELHLHKLPGRGEKELAQGHTEHTEEGCVGDVS